MADKKKLLEQRKELKNKKPSFRRHDSHKKHKLKSNWRRPKGLQNKLRLNKRGYGTKVSTGWGSPKAVKGLHPSGLEPVRVNNVNDLKEVDKKEQGVIIASAVGDRKRVQIIEEAKKQDIKILNLDPDKYMEKVEKRLKKQKAEKKEREDRKKKTEKEAEKEAEKQEEKEEKEEELSEEEKKKQEKKEKDKVLTKK